MVVCVRRSAPATPAMRAQDRVCVCTREPAEIHGAPFRPLRRNRSSAADQGRAERRVEPPRATRWYQHTASTARHVEIGRWCRTLVAAKKRAAPAPLCTGQTLCSPFAAASQPLAALAHLEDDRGGAWPSVSIEQR